MKLVSIFVFVTCLGASFPALAQGKKQPVPDEQPPQKPGVPRRHEPKPAPIQPKAQPSVVGLDTAKALFELTDANADGTLDLTEAASAGLGPRDVASGDLDSNHLLSHDEFLVAFGTNQSRLGRPVSGDLTQEAARIAAARSAPAKPAPGPRVAETPGSSDPKSEIERKIDEALRTAKASTESGPAAPGSTTKADVKRERRPGARTESGDLDAKLHQSLVELNRRLRDAEVTPEEAANQRQELQQRFANAEAARGEETSEEGESEPRAAPNSEEVARAAMEKRLAEEGATPEKIAEARARFEARLQKSARAEARKADAGDGESSGATPDDKKSPEEVAAARAKFGKRLNETKRAEAASQNAAGADSAPAPDPASDPASAPPAESGEGRSKVVAEKVGKRLADQGATPEEIAKARERVQRRSEAARGDEQAPRERTPPDTGGAAPKAPLPEKHGEKPPAAERPAAEQPAGRVREAPKDAPQRTSKVSSPITTRDPLLEPALEKPSPPRFGALASDTKSAAVPDAAGSQGKWLLKADFERASALRAAANAKAAAASAGPAAPRDPRAAAARPKGAGKGKGAKGKRARG